MATGALTAVLVGEGDPVGEAALGAPGVREEFGVGVDVGGGTGVDV